MAKLKLSSSKDKNALLLAHACRASYTQNPKASTSYAKIELGPPLPFGDVKSSIGDFGLAAASGKRVVIALRGTDDFVDWLKNLSYDLTGFQNGRAHKGFLAGMHSLYDQAAACLELLDSPARKELIITGHSLGGAIGVLMAAKMEAEQPFRHPKRISVFGFGIPRVGDVDFYNNYPLADSTHLYINEADLVPMMPLTTQDYVHAAEQTLLNRGKRRVIDLDSREDAYLHFFRVGPPSVRDHRIKEGYIKGLANTSASSLG